MCVLGMFETIAVLVTLAAVLAYVNARFVKLPQTIGLMVLALFLSLAIVVVGQFAPWVQRAAEALLAGIDFDEALLHGMLGYLLFAGALHVDLDDLREQKFIVAALATVGVLVTTALVGAMTWGVAQLLGLDLPVIYCAAFGALIAPTDPIAVLALLKRMGVPKSLETKIAGESLFNDGIGVVVFLAILAIIAGGAHGSGTHGEAPGALSVLRLFAIEALGGVGFGLAIGFLAYLMLRSLDNYATEVLISLALVTGGYALASWLHVSGPLAMVVAGLLIGNHGRTLAMSEATRAHLDTFWELVDEVLNAVLFVLIGLEVLVLSVQWSALLAGVIAIPVVLVGRWVSVAGAVTVLRAHRDFTPHVVKVLTWAGLRGGISVALALSLRDTARGLAEAPGGVASAEAVLVMTYVVVIFSIVVQGLTTGRLLRRLGVSGAGPTA